MHAPHQVKHHHRVSHPQPQCKRRIRPQVLGNLRHKPHDRHKSRHRQRLKRIHPGRHIIAKHGGHGLTKPQMQRPIRGGGVPPIVGNLKQNLVWITRRPLRVGIQPIAQQRALHQVGIHIPRHDRRRPHQRDEPHAQCAAHIVGADNLVDHQLPHQHPGHHEQHRAQPQGHIRKRGTMAKTQKIQVRRGKQTIALLQRPPTKRPQQNQQRSHKTKLAHHGGSQCADEANHG